MIARQSVVARHAVSRGERRAGSIDGMTITTASPTNVRR
jgi:hypothetical protein